MFLCLQNTINKSTDEILIITVGHTNNILVIPHITLTHINE